MSDFSTRLETLLPTKEAIDAMAAALERSPSGVTHWVKGRREPDLETIKQIAQLKNTSPAWLAFGIEEPGAGQVPSFEDPLPLLASRCNDAQKRVLTRLLKDILGEDAG